MRTKFNKPWGRRMSTAEDIEEARPLLEKLLAHHLRAKQAGKMDAYAAIGSAIGMSSSWVRNVFGRQGRVGLKHRTMKRIEALTARLEAIAEHNRHVEARLKGDSDAASAARTGGGGVGRGVDDDARDLGGLAPASPLDEG